MTDTILLVLVNLFILAMLALDLGIIQRRAHFPTMKEALGWSAVWIAVSLLFSVLVWYLKGSQPALEYLTGYVVEYALSVDNVFVFILIFSYFSVPQQIQHKVLFWGVLSAIIFRAVFILLGAALVAKFHWILYVLGAFLVVTAFKLAMQSEMEVHPERNPFIKIARRLIPISQNYDGSRFFTRIDGRLFATPLFIVLLMIETTDVAFATDSIPAIFAITRDTFIIYTSNIFAILGLRSLYFVVSGYMKEFRYLRFGLSAVLGFIGLKMLIEPWFKIPIAYSLLTIFSLIVISVLLSILADKKDRKALRNETAS